jgi:hypothetical protein
LAKHSGVYKSEKRKKELLRQKKQEEKRKRRFQKNVDTEQTIEKDAEKTESGEA